jgi:hypothetical protein
MRRRLQIVRERNSRTCSFASIENAIAAVRAGQMVIVVDDENRENQGDLTVAAEKTAPQVINFMAQYGRGLICLAMTPEHLDALEILINVYSGEVEAVIYKHPAVREVAVFEIPDPQWDESVMACVVLKPGMALSANDLTSHCRQFLANYKIAAVSRFQVPN